VMADTSMVAVGTSTTVTFTATDAAGNDSSCTTEVEVTDQTAPVITCPADQTLVADAMDCSIPDFGSATVSDNCDGASTVMPDTSGVQVGTSSTVTFEAMDAAGNEVSCSTVVEVLDETPPVLTCPPKQEFDADDMECFIGPVVLEALSADNCAGDTTLCIETSRVGLGTTTVTFKTTDPAGNDASCSTEIEVTDVTPPVLDPSSASEICIWPPNSLFHCVDIADFVMATDNCFGQVTVTPSESDLCVSDPPPDPLAETPVVNCFVDEDGQVCFRAGDERSKGSKKGADSFQGRRYTVSYNAVDEAGNSAVLTRTVYSPPLDAIDTSTCVMADDKVYDGGKGSSESRSASRRDRTLRRYSHTSNR